MEVGLVLRERPADEAHIVAVEEVIGHMRGLVGIAGVLGFAGDVDAAENYLPALAVAKLAVFDREAEAAHCLRSGQEFVKQRGGCRAVVRKRHEGELGVGMSSQSGDRLGRPWIWNGALSGHCRWQ
jgi:hypothetical protein